MKPYLTFAAMTMLAVGMTVPAFAQAAPPVELPETIIAQPPLPPATQLEAFQPTAGALQTMGFDVLGAVQGGSGRVSVDVRQVMDARGQAARGLVVEVTENEHRKDHSFIDADELPELVKGVDALLGLQGNPTTFKNFEVTYRTKGELEVTASNTGAGAITYAVRAGRVLTAQAVSLKLDDMLRLRGMFQAAVEKLATLSGPQ